MYIKNGNKKLYRVESVGSNKCGNPGVRRKYILALADPLRFLLATTQAN